MSAITPSDFSYIRDLVRRHAAISLEQDKSYLLELRLAPLARDAGFASLAEFIGALRQETAVSPMYRQVVEALTTHETFFFRDGHPFETLQNTVLPKLLQERAPRAVNIWCAACSSGQEPYSIAMLLRENFPGAEQRRVRIIASDISQAIVERARSGMFNQIEISRGLSPKLLSRYFDKQGQQWRIRQEIRRMVEFEASNLIGAWPKMPDLDVVFMRNVMIYFDIEVKKTLLSKVRQVLKPDGYLFLGSSETTLNLDPSFVPIMLGKTTCYQLLNS